MSKITKPSFISRHCCRLVEHVAVRELAVFLMVSLAWSMGFAHPLDELGTRPYRIGNEQPLDVAVALERDGRLELGFYLEMNSSMLERPEEATKENDQNDGRKETRSIKLSAKHEMHIKTLFEVMCDRTALTPTLSFRKENREREKPESIEIWVQVSYGIIDSRCPLTLVVNPVIIQSQIGIIDALESSKSRLVQIGEKDTKIVALRGDGDRSHLEPRAQALKERLYGQQSLLNEAVAYIALGFIHIIPRGLDHILFILGLFLISTRLRPLIGQVTAFTAAHTITLAFAILGWVKLDALIVEPLIALSIAYIGIENFFKDQIGRTRLSVVFVFGLLHGLGFAGVLSELGLSPSHFTASLIAFNIGVELGQLSVLLVAALTTIRFWSKPWYRTHIVIPSSLLIALTGIYWAIERAFFSA